MLQVSALYCYPIKSLGGFSLTEAQVTDRGLQWDRRWMLADERGQFLSQRSLPQMALLQVSLHGNGLLVTHKQSGARLLVPFELQTSDTIRVTVWDATTTGARVSREADAWFSDVLQRPCTLVYMPDEAPIAVEPEYATEGEITSFSDGYPFMLIGQSSLDDLNSKLAAPIPMNRFRPNIVVLGAAPYAEDHWQDFTIGTTRFLGAKRCGRCVVTTINQDTSTIGKEPLKTLATYRQKGNRIYFGLNLLHRGGGTIRVGDPVNLVR